MPSSGVGPTPNRLGRYHLAEPLGGGPTGEVFRAKVYGVAGFERQFAVKRFHAAFVKDPATAEAVAAAARVYGGLEHPRIARLHEYGVTGGHAFTAVELIDGLDLSRLLSLLDKHGRKLPHGAAAALTAQIARTLGYAHGRGISHLGLCPTNIIVTTDGEARITDFGFLPPRLPRQPAQDPSLGSRLPYLAPEQLSHESTSSATDVFQLGAIAYEIFTGKAAWSGAGSQAVAQAILSGNAPSAELPRPLQAVLQRCLSRSPFERYPDARALADGMDAAARDLSLAGGLPDIALIVRELMTETSQGDDQGDMSGALSFPLPAPPRGDAMMDHLRSDDELPATTIRDPVAPASPPPAPPIPVGIQNSRSANAPTVTGSPLRPTPRPLHMEPLLGPVEELDEEMPTVIRERERGFVRPTPVGLAVVDKVAALLDDEPSGPETSASPGAADAADDAADERATIALTPAPPILPPPRLDTPPVPSLLDDAEELSGSHLEAVEESERIQLAPRDSDSNRPAEPLAPSPAPEPPPTLIAPSSLTPIARPSQPRLRANLPETMSDALPAVRVEDTWEPLTPIPRIGAMPGSAASPSTGPSARPEPGIKPAEPARAARGGSGKSGIKWVIAGLLVLIVGAGGYLVYSKFMADSREKPGDQTRDQPDTTPAAIADAGADTGGSGADAGTAPPPDAGGQVAVASKDAGMDASAGISIHQTPTQDGKLTIRSTPRGAKVYLDGSSIGKTPHTLDATADRHRLAIIHAGYKLYSAEIQGSGLVEVTLQEAAPPDDPGGIKVRCSRKNRYLIFVDGVDTGQLCPSERIGVDEGEHVVQIYDPVTESRREFPVAVKGTRNSVRVRVD